MPASLGRRGAQVVLALVVLVVLVAAGWTWLTLSWAYSVGERAGVLQKFSRKGWMCKTHEGELAQYVVGGVAPQIDDAHGAATDFTLQVVTAETLQLRSLRRRLGTRGRTLLLPDGTRGRGGSRGHGGKR